MKKTLLVPLWLSGAGTNHNEHEFQTLFIQEDSVL